MIVISSGVLMFDTSLSGDDAVCAVVIVGSGKCGSGDEGEDPADEGDDDSCDCSVCNGCTCEGNMALPF